MIWSRISTLGVMSVILEMEFCGSYGIRLGWYRLQWFERKFTQEISALMVE